MCKREGGTGEWSSRQTSLTSHTHTLTMQDIHSVYESLLQRDIKLHFLQVLTPGGVYPDRISRIPSPPSQNRSPGDSPSDLNGACSPTPEGEVESSLQGSHSKKFELNKVGLPWETVDTVHWFMYPGTCIHVHVHVYTCFNERRKEERSKQGQTNNKAKQHSTPKAVTFPKKNVLPRVGLEPTTLYTLHSRQSALPLSYRGSFSWLGPHVRVRVFVQHSSIGIAIAIGLHVHVHQKHKVNLPTAGIWLRKVDIQPTCCLHMLFVHSCL